MEIHAPRLPNVRHAGLMTEKDIAGAADRRIHPMGLFGGPDRPGAQSVMGGPDPPGRVGIMGPPNGCTVGVMSGRHNDLTVSVMGQPDRPGLTGVMEARRR